VNLAKEVYRKVTDPHTGVVTMVLNTRTGQSQWKAPRVKGLRLLNLPPVPPGVAVPHPTSKLGWLDLGYGACVCGCVCVGGGGGFGRTHALSSPLSPLPRYPLLLSRTPRPCILNLSSLHPLHLHIYTPSARAALFAPPRCRWFVGVGGVCALLQARPRQRRRLQ
jgi:hypothetical protein